MQHLSLCLFKCMYNEIYINILFNVNNLGNVKENCAQ